MTVATGNPVFESVGGDISKATVLPTGGNAPVAMEDLAKTVGKNSEDSASALSTAGKANTSAASALSVANAAMPAALRGAKNGVPILNADGDVDTGLNSIRMGYTGSTSIVGLNMYLSGQTDGNGGSPDAGFVGMGQTGTGNRDGRLMLMSASFEPWNDNQTQIGSASNRVAQVFSAASSLNTSDVRQKTNIISLMDSAGLGASVGAAASDDEATKLLQIGRDLPIAIFTMTDGTRRHVGTLAQAVQAAFAKQGLDAANYGMWGEDKLYDLIAKTVAATETYTDDNGNTKTRPVEKTVYENIPRMKDGVQETLQSVRLDQVCALKLAALQYDLADLTVKVPASSTTAA